MALGEWDHRELCPDGACVGVIGPDGTCKLCGRAAPNWGDERNRGLVDPADANTAAAAAAETLPRTTTTDGGAWPERRLCDDGACIGVIGPDGRCTVCGRPGTVADGATEAEDRAAPVGSAGDRERYDIDATGEVAEVGVTGAQAARASTPPADGDEPGDDAERELCRDGACIGVIGPDGTCKVCGKAAAG